LIWSLTRAKFCQLIAILSVVLPQLNRTKLKFELYWSSTFSAKKDKRKNFTSLEFDFFFEFSSSCFQNTAAKVILQCQMMMTQFTVLTLTRANSELYLLNNSNKN